MKFQDITNDTKSLYRLGAHEQGVFFLCNRSGDITFELVGPHARAYVFAFFVGKGHDRPMIHIAQRHLSPQTTSRVLVKSILTDTAEFSYRGILQIGKDAPLSDASQENRNLLLSRDAKVFSEPALEILNDNVRCHHAVTTSPLNEELLFLGEARGLPRKQAKELLIRGFFRSSIDTMNKLTSSQESEKMLALLLKALP